MADDQSQRPYRASEPPVRSAAKPTGSDPLAELARLIGQTDPFAEFGREPARRAAAPQPGEPADWNAQPLGSPYAPQAGAGSRSPAPTQKLGGNGYYSAMPAPAEQPMAPPQNYGGQSYGRQPFGGAPLPNGSEDYQIEQDAHGYPADQAGYEQDSYEHDTHRHAEEEYYEDTPPSRRRLGIMAIAGVFALAVIGTAGAFGYRAMFGSSGSNQPPPVIKADAGPSKVVPATSGKDAQSNKLISDRINERGQSEKLVSREEQPMDKPAVAVLSQAAPQAALGNGVVAGDAKKVRTIAIRPDQAAIADATPSSSLAAAPPTRAVPAPQVQAPAPAPAPAPRAAPPLARATDNATADAEQDQPPAPVARTAPPVRQAAPAPGSNAPLSLNPNAAPARAAAAPVRAAPAPAAAATTRTASLPPAAASSANAGGPGSYVQVSSQRSESEAQTAFRALQAKFPAQLGSRQPLVHKVDLGAKGTYYRAMVGPFANANEAAELCSSLKAAGGQCLIQRN